MTDQRLERLLRRAVRGFGLELTGMAVLTEAASGPFVVTPLLAALGGSERVLAVTRDSGYGTAKAVIEDTYRLARSLGVADRITVVDRPAIEFAEHANVVTNLGHVRPIGEALVRRLPADAGVALMCEPWEAREGDVDRAACARRGIPVLGTNERDPRLRTFEYVGLLALKLLLEEGVEVFGCRILVIGSEPFGDACERCLTKMGATVSRLDPTRAWGPRSVELQPALEDCDAIVLAEHRYRGRLIGEAAIDPANLRHLACVARIAGDVDVRGLAREGVRLVPERDVPAGVMSVTTAYVGVRPVIDLHAAGLRVGQALVEGMRRTGDRRGAVEHALCTSPAVDFDGPVP